VAVAVTILETVLLEDLAEELHTTTVAKVEEQELLEKEIMVEFLDQLVVMLLQEAVAVKVKPETLTEHLKVELTLLLLAGVEMVHKVILLEQQLIMLAEELVELMHLHTHHHVHKLKVAKVAVEMVMEIGLIKIMVGLKTAVLILAEVLEDFIRVELLEKQVDQEFV
jgi:hypothetical protein